MDSTKRIELLTRDSVLKLLSNDEVARVSMDESAPWLKNGDEYLDLLQLNKGVQVALHGSLPETNMGHVLARKSVQEGTWLKILSQLPPAMVQVQVRG